MGAWGVKTFENDESSDWLYDLEEVSDLSVIEAVINQYSADYLESLEGAKVLAAAEIIIALIGKVNRNLPDNVHEWVSNNQPLDVSHLIPNTVSTVDAVLSDQSELKELWEETDEFDRWQKVAFGVKPVLAYN